MVFGKSFQEVEDTSDEEGGGGKGPELHPGMEVTEVRILVEKVEDLRPSGRALVGLGINGSVSGVERVENAASPSLEHVSEGVEVVSDSEADIPGEHHSNKHDAQHKSVGVDKSTLSEILGALVGSNGVSEDLPDGEDGEDTNGPDHGLEDTPKAVEGGFKGSDLCDEGFTIEATTGTGVISAVKGNSRSGIENHSVLDDLV